LTSRNPVIKTRCMKNIFKLNLILLFKKEFVPNHFKHSTNLNSKLSLLYLLNYNQKITIQMFKKNPGNCNIK